MYPGLYEVHATPAADRIARGEEWLQTFSLDGTRDIEAFIMPDEPAYFQEFGPGGYHVAIGFANPAKINARRPSICAGAESGCDATLNGQVTNLRISRTPDQRVYSSGSYEASSYTNCYVSVGYPDSADFAFTKCNADGTFSFNAAEGNGVPEGNLKVTVFDQYNDLLVDGLSTPVRTAPLNVDGTDNANCNPAGECFYEIAVTQWRANLYGRIFLDQNNDGVSQDDEEPGLPLVPYNIRYRDGSYMGFNNTDLAGFAGFNEVFPFVHWLVVDTDSARYKQTGVHVVYDAGGAVDGTPGGGTSTVAAALANTIESPTAHVPASQRIPGARYCANADCTGTGSFNPASGNPGSTGRVDPGWVPAEAWQGLLGQASFINFALSPFAPGENGGIKGHVVYTSTRPFDDPALLFHLQWEPLVPNVTVNLYREGIGPDGTKSLQFVDTTQSTSWDDWAQGFRSDGMPNMSCPGLEQTSPFYFTMENSTQWLNPTTPLPANSRFKCHDGWAMLNQVQPAPYNGMYKFPSVTARDPVTGMPTATNCTGCIPNPAPVGDPDRDTPMLPPGKYVVEIVIPPGYELVKEEDKNILLGDLYIAPVTTQFAGFGNIFILPDQAAINAYYNPYNPLQSTTNNGASPRAEGDTGSIEVYWPCVGATRIVPDFNSLFPGAGQAAPFAGASRPLCDRKEVVLTDAMTVLAKFYVFTSAHISSSFSGLSTNDFAGEFDPFSPQFGEKAAVANIPVAIKDFTGKEISRVYGDQWGRFNGKNYSSWTINPPSPSGFIPQMMIVCMNDPGPILDTRPGSPTLGQMITDPFYNPAYSDFCYEQPFMPGQTQYLDTPVVPTMAFAAQYNLPDCEYPDTTPAIKSVNASGTGQGPWVDQPGRSLTITALGDKQVLNHAYSGPQADTSPFNQKFITRHYGFGEQCITPNGSATCNTVSSVTIGGVNAPITAWTDSQITVTVPALTSAQSNCPLAQRTTPAAIGSSARCGQVVITAGNGKQSIDAITVTIAGKPPTYVAGPNAANNALQTAIDNAVPGDLIIVGPGTYKELLLMWKPVRLQGVGAESVIINADAHPAGKLDPWRRQVNCLFGLTLEGQPANAPYAGCPATMLGRVDRAPGEPIIGWNASLNGNLAEQLVEPTLMGAYEGAGITVLGRGFRFPVGGDRFNVGAADEDQALPDGATYLTSSNADCNRAANPPLHRDFATSNFLCNPSRIDGITITNGSQGGGGIFAHAWNHFLEISNNRTYANHGTLSGGVVIGIGEFGAPYIVGGADPIPFAVPPGLANGTQLGRGLNRNVRVHHNAVTSNASLGDSLYSGTFSAAGGVSFCTGSDNYLFNYNWICGNVSSGDAGGVAHVGFTNDGRIERNWILFNQSASPTIPVHGGGLAILGASPDRTLPNGDECGTTNDLDCPPGLPEGTGRNLVIDANLILGNSAQSGTGGGLRLQGINGEDVIAFPTRPNPITTGPIANRSPGWNSVTVINNIIANNVAGWDGGGVSMQDALKVSFVNNTVISNDTTASAGVLFNTLGAPNASVPPPGCTPQPDPTQPQDPSCINPVIESTYQPAGLVTMAHTPNLIAALGPDNPGTQVVCPAGFGYGAGAALNDGSCREVSLPLLSNDLFWQNRAFRIEVGALGGGQQNQQAVVTLVPSLNQGPVPPGGTGFCDLLGEDNGAPESGNPVNYWDIGVRGDVTPTPDSGSGFALNPMFSILTETAGYTGAGLLEADPEVVAQYCNGSRLPPEGGGTFAGFNAPPGRSETTGLYPVFALNQITPAATVDEGNNWIDLNYGPLSLANAATAPPTGTAQDPLGNYDITAASPAITAATPTGAPDHDFFGRSRPLGAGFDIGAVEFFAPPPPLPSLPVLDNFNRANANNLNIGFAPGTNWSLPTPLLGGTLRALRVVNNAAEAFLLPLLTNWAVWNGPGNVFGANQGAAFTFVNAPVNGIGSWLVLKASGGSASTPANYIRVRYLPAGQVEIATTNNGNTLLPNYTVRATLSATFASGDRLTALAGPTGTVSVWRTTAANVTTFVGSVPIPTTGAGAWTQGTGGGRVGLLLPIGARVDDFAGGTVP
jgi:hypothetical protein